MSVCLICFSANNDDDGFDLIQPSLIQQLRSILDQYPDDGQILKVEHTTFVKNRRDYRKLNFLSSICSSKVCRYMGY